jgi:hypothetical protein
MKYTMSQLDQLPQTEQEVALLDNGGTSDYMICYYLGITLDRLEYIRESIDDILNPDEAWEELKPKLFPDVF